MNLANPVPTSSSLDCTYHHVANGQRLVED